MLRWEALFSGSNVSPDLRRADAESLALYLRARIERELRKNSFRVVSEKPMFGRDIELAIAQVSSTDVIRNVLGAALGTFVPGGGIIAISTSCRTASEGVVRDASTEKPLFVFADRERRRISPFRSNDFTRYSHARAAIGDWAEQIKSVDATRARSRNVPRPGWSRRRHEENKNYSERVQKNLNTFNFSDILVEEAVIQEKL